MNARLTAGNGKTAPSLEKLRGGYYTPPAIADSLVKWAITSRDMRVLEPSCGDGVFVRAAAARLGSRGHITAIEYDPAEADKVTADGEVPVDVLVHDAFTWFNANPDVEGRFDVVVGNPPFIRYQNFLEEQRNQAFHMMRQEGLHPSRLTNAWLPFVVLATRALREGGRLGLVLPAELMQVGYACELREYLARKYSHLTLVTFRRLVFEGIQQETVLLLGERADCQSAAIAVREVEEINDLGKETWEAPSTLSLDLEHAREKWTQYYLSKKELGLIRCIERDGVPSLGDFAEVRVGVVTGRNDFFVLSPATAEELGVEEWVRPLVGRSSQIPGIRIGPDEWNALRESGSRCLLLDLPHESREDLPASALAYVEHGEALGIHKGFKCRIRTPAWWQVPSTWTPDGFMLRQIHMGPRIVMNDCAATSTDTIHRIRVGRDVDASQVAAYSMNSMTWAFSEIRGRSYGGGVLELEPREAMGLPFPEVKQELDIDALDSLVRSGATEKALDACDAIALQGIGLSQDDIETLRGVWRKLSERRLARKT